jgi:hypothetical protein
LSAEPVSRRRFISTGTLLVLGLGLVLVVGWFGYKPMIPPVWLHAFGADIALRAEVDPDAPLPQDSRQASPRGLADSPYICVAKLVTQPWDRIVFVTANQDLHTYPVLTAAKWPGDAMEDVAAELAKDKRYQLIVLIKDNAVIDAQKFFTFWANLEGVARPDGFTPADAIFTATSKDGVYVVSLAENAPPEACH